MSIELLLLLGVSPSVVAIVAIVIAVVKLVASGKDTKDIILEENIQLKEELKVTHAENRELRKLLKEHLTKIDRIQRPKEE